MSEDALSLKPDVSVFRPDRRASERCPWTSKQTSWRSSGGNPALSVLTVRNVFEVLYERRRIAYTTVMNTMSRLARKRLLRVEKREHAYVYYPNFTQKEFVSRLPRAFSTISSSVSVDAARAEPAQPWTRQPLIERALLEEITRRRAVEEAD